MKARRHLFHRVDPRLVHSTLLEAWVPHLQAVRLVLADEALVENERQRNIIELTTRDKLRCDFVRPQDLKEHLETLDRVSTIVLYESLRSLVRAVEHGVQVKKLYIGHLPSGEGKVQVHPAVFVGKDELACIQTILDRGTQAIVWPLPSDEKLGLHKGDDDSPVVTAELQDATGEFTPLAVDALEPSQQATEKDGVVKVVNERGLHLRAAHLLAQAAGGFQASVELGVSGRMVNAKSLLGITTLGAALGTELRLLVTGPDAEQAFAAISALFEAGFHEDAP